MSEPVNVAKCCFFLKFPPHGAAFCEYNVDHVRLILLIHLLQVKQPLSFFFSTYVRNILSCQSAGLVNSSAQQPCWLPLGRRANKQMWTKRDWSLKAGRGGGEVRHNFCFWFHSTLQLIGWMRRGRKKKKYKHPHGSQAAPRFSCCGERTIERQGPQMPNTSTAGHSWKGNPPPTNLPCMFTHIAKRGEKRGLHCVSELFRFHLEKTAQAENFVFWFSSSPLLPLFFLSARSIDPTPSDYTKRTSKLKSGDLTLFSIFILCSQWNYGQGCDIVSAQQSP